MQQRNSPQNYSSYISDLIYFQKMDQNIGKIRKNLLNSFNKSSNELRNFILINNILYIYKDSWKLYVPQDYVVQTIDHINCMLNNKYNFIKEIKELSHNFHWIGMLRDLKSYYRCNKIII